jgi:hypothetical protein
MNRDHEEKPGYRVCSSRRESIPIWGMEILLYWIKTCFPMIIRGTLVYDVQIGLDTMKTGSKLLYYYPHLQEE